MTLVYLIAGESSGDVLGARLLAAMRAKAPGIRAAGIGGDRLAEQGMASLFPMRDLALMGLMEVLPNIRRLARRLDETVADITARRPDVVVTIDSPGFTSRIAKRIRPLGIPIVHYVAPQIWGWRAWRVKEIAQQMDRLLCLLPFEPPMFLAAGLDARFVGHPVLESGAETGDAARFRAQHGIGPDERVVLVMPGSRRTEITRMLPVFAEALRLAETRVPGLRPVVPLAGPVEAAVRAATASWSPAPILVTTLADKHDAFAAASAGLIKSGTSSLEVAMAGVPMLIGYKVNWLTGEILRRIATAKYAAIVNLLADAPIIPEFLQERCTPALLADALVELLTDPAIGAVQVAGARDLLDRLRPPGGGSPSEAAADAVLGVLAKP
ncbi:lipid-A-disaccharide synthase [Humitalea sp. 24SJ18S-53]|uniref:lipid-A-disaccharide synthase n=1 Tax=Humitalea sp. 24SJ18S-53 TaxID=3422307 RepID=UPI003D666577